GEFSIGVEHCEESFRAGKRNFAVRLAHGEGAAADIADPKDPLQRGVPAYLRRPDAESERRRGIGRLVHPLKSKVRIQLGNENAGRRSRFRGESPVGWIGAAEKIRRSRPVRTSDVSIASVVG